MDHQRIAILQGLGKFDRKEKDVKNRFLKFHDRDNGKIKLGSPIILQEEINKC
jgi:hypothetical protein